MRLFAFVATWSTAGCRAVEGEPSGGRPEEIQPRLTEVAQPPRPADLDPSRVGGPLVVSHECSFDTRHAGGQRVARTLRVDLGAAVATYRETNTPAGVAALADPAEAETQTPRPSDRRAPLAPADVAQIDQLARDMLRRTSWPVQSAPMDGEACHLAVIDSNGKTLVAAQRQTAQGDDAPAALLRAVQGLPLRWEVSKGSEPPLDGHTAR